MARWAILAVLAVSGLVIGVAMVPAPVDKGFKDYDGSKVRTQADAEAILGPPGDYAAASEERYFMFVSGRVPTGRPVVWRDDHVIVEMYFSSDGDRSYWNCAPAIPRSNVFYRLRRMVG